MTTLSFYPLQLEIITTISLYPLESKLIRGWCTLEDERRGEAIRGGARRCAATHGAEFVMGRVGIASGRGGEPETLGTIASGRGEDPETLDPHPYIFIY